MTTEIVFPDIALPLRDSVVDTFEDTRSKVQMETGATRIRRRNRTAPRIYELSWDMSQEEFALFDEWYQYTINGGDLPFDIQIQDDLGDLAWLTAKGLDDYSAKCINGFDWQVTWKVRSTQPIFYGRIPVPFSGRASIGVQGLGDLEVLKPLYGISSIGIVAGTVFVPPGPLMGVAGPSGIVLGTGNLLGRPLWGMSVVSITATGMFLDLGESEVILQFDAVSWTPPDGDDVVLQFDDVEYMPPSV
jgi:hypothetical protein